MTNVRFESFCDKEYRPTSGDFVTRLALRMSISDLAETLPLNLCLVLDRSMSMTGTKIKEAVTGARQLIQVLRPGDRFSLIAFSSTADVLLEHVDMDEDGKQRAEQALEGLSPRGVTRMDLALEQGYALLAQLGDSHLNMLVLLSDGAPTNHVGYVLEGTERNDLSGAIAQSLKEHGIVTSTVGLGDAGECLAPFLEECAETGQGVFYHEDDPGQLADRFLEEFHRVKNTAVTEARFFLSDLEGRVRKAAAIYPDLRELATAPTANGELVLEVGALQKGEEHVFLLELVTSGKGDSGRRKLCNVSAGFQLEGSRREVKGEPVIIEFTDEETLLGKPGHSEAEKYKAMYMAFQQTRFATENVRAGGDAKKTRVLLQSAAKTTRRLGMAKQTRLLNAMADNLDHDGSLSENQLAEIATASRKTKVLSAS